MKVTCFFVIYFLIFTGCQPKQLPDDELYYQQQMDSVASSRIDSAYALFLVNCDSLQKIMVPIVADSIVHAHNQNPLP
jgi:hypothetical protein